MKAHKKLSRSHIALLDRGSNRFRLFNVETCRECGRDCEAPEAVNINFHDLSAGEFAEKIQESGLTLSNETLPEIVHSRMTIESRALGYVTEHFCIDCASQY